MVQVTNPPPAGTPWPTAGALDLEALLEPQSIAIIGASDHPNRVGGMPLHFLHRAGYGGPVYPVNPKRATVQGHPSFASVADIGETVDLAIIAVPAQSVVGTVEECAAAGVRGAVIFSGGFAETDAAGRRRQDELRRIAENTGLRICGPNCAGIMNVRQRMTASFGSHLAADTTLLPGSIAVVSQSGAVGAYIFTLARQRLVGLSQWITTGNEVDLQVADFVAALAGDSDTDVIAVYLEQVRDADRFLRACEVATANGKRLVGLLGGRSAAAAEALRSHTASMAGDRLVAITAIEEAGVSLVATIDDLLSGAIGMAGRRPRGTGVGIITISGAAGVMMVDRSHDVGLDVPPLPAPAQDRLKALLPYAGTANPIDVTGNISNNPDLFGAFLAEVLGCSTVDTVVCFLGHVLLSPHVGERLVNEVIAASAGSDKPVWLVGIVSEPDQAARLSDAGIPLLTDPSRAIDALRAALGPGPAGGERPASLFARRQAAEQRQRPLPRVEGSALSEVEAQALLTPYGVRFPRQFIATRPAEAKDALARFGGRGVIKVLSPDISHKAAVGGVRVGVGEAEATTVFSEILAAVESRTPGARVEGVLVQEEIDGYPVIVGTRIDETFGAVVMVGTGGIHTELFGDRALALAPVDAAGAEALIGRTSLLPFLDPSGSGRVPAVLVDLVVSLSELSWCERERFAAIELNPVLLSQSGAVAVDALIELGGSQHGT